MNFKRNRLYAYILNVTLWQTVRHNGLYSPDQYFGQVMRISSTTMAAGLDISTWVLPFTGVQVRNKIDSTSPTLAGIS